VHRCRDQGRIRSLDVDEVAVEHRRAHCGRSRVGQRSGARSKLATETKTHHAQSAAPARHGHVWLPQTPLAGVGADEESVLTIRLRCSHANPSRGHRRQLGVHAHPTPLPATIRRAKDNIALAPATSPSCTPWPHHPIATPVGPPLEFFRYCEHRRSEPRVQRIVDIVPPGSPRHVSRVELYGAARSTKLTSHRDKNASCSRRCSSTGEQSAHQHTHTHDTPRLEVEEGVRTKSTRAQHCTSLKLRMFAALN
jgi:ribosome assembly protein YihI (activator of Der GTPase)